MGRAFYRFDHDLALRVPNGQAFALRNPELGAFFEGDALPICIMRGSFSYASLRGLMARGLIPPKPEILSITQAVAVQLHLKPELAKVFKDANSFHQFCRRMDLNNATDEVARKLLMFESWRLNSVVALAEVSDPKHQVMSPERAVQPFMDEQEAALTDLLGTMAAEMWVAAEEALMATPSPEEAYSAIEETVNLFFELEEWETFSETEGVLRSVYDGQNGSWMCYTQILPELEHVLFYSVCPVAVPANALPVMAEYLCRVNANLSLGNFEIDFDHLVVRFRTSVDVADVGLTPLLFRNLVFQNLAAMDLYLPEVLGIIAGKQIALPTA